MMCYCNVSTMHASGSALYGIYFLKSSHGIFIPLTKFMIFFFCINHYSHHVLRHRLHVSESDFPFSFKRAFHFVSVFSHKHDMSSCCDNVFPSQLPITAKHKLQKLPRNSHATIFSARPFRAIFG
ncbi:hypothetical protein S83_024910 [Arachis hypogaea]